VTLNAFHSQIVNGVTVLTESFTNERGYLPRPAGFRNTLTRTCQGDLFPDLEMPDADGRMYAILTHGAWPDNDTQPGFADILIPALDRDKAVVADRIRLFEDRFAELVAARRSRIMHTADPEVIQDEARPQFRSGEDVGG
jgi:hypothetical protein